MEFFMENLETTKIKALSRVKLLAIVLFLLVLIGAYIEWQKKNKPLAEAIVIYKITEKKVDEIKSGTEVIEEKQIAPKDEVVVKENIEKENVSDDQNVEVKNNNIVAEFVAEIDEINQKLDDVKKPESALDKIIPLEVKKEEKKEQVIFKDGEIEVFDDKNGVVKVESIPVVENNDEISVTEENTDNVEKVNNDDGYEVTLDEVNASNGMESEDIVENNQDKKSTEVVKEPDTLDAIENSNEERISVENKDVSIDTESSNVVDNEVKKNTDNEVKNVEPQPEVNDMIDENALAEYKAKEEVLNISVEEGVNIEEAENNNVVAPREVKESDFNGVKMKINENGISFIGDDGVEIKIDDEGLMVNNPEGNKINMNESGVIIKEGIDDESGEVVIDKIEPIVNTEKSSFEIRPMEDDDAPINLLKGIAEGE